MQQPSQPDRNNISIMTIDIIFHIVKFSQHNDWIPKTVCLSVLLSFLFQFHSFQLQGMTQPIGREEESYKESDIPPVYNGRNQRPHNTPTKMRHLASSRKDNDLKPPHVSFAFNPQYSISAPSLHSVPQIVVSPSPAAQPNGSQEFALMNTFSSKAENLHCSSPTTPTIPSPVLSEDIDYTPRTSVDDYDRHQKKNTPYYQETDDEDDNNDRMSNVDTLYGSPSVYSDNEDEVPIGNFSCGCCPLWWMQRAAWFRRTVINLCIFTVIFVPGLTARLVLRNDFRIISIPIDRWFEFFGLVIFGFHISRLVVYITLKCIRYFSTGKLQTRIEMLQFIQFTIALCLWALACLSGWHFIIKGPDCANPNICDEAKLFPIIGNIIESLVYACFAFCLERIILIQISTVFKKGAYTDRIVQCQFESDMIEAMLKCRHIDKVEKKMAKAQSRRPSQGELFDSASFNGSLRHNFAPMFKSQPEYPSHLIHCSSESQYGASSIATRISVEVEEKLKPSKAGLEIPEGLLDVSNSRYGERKHANISVTQMTKYIQKIRTKKLLNVIGSIEDANKYAKKIYLRLCPRNRGYIAMEEFQRVFNSKTTQDFVFQWLDKDMDGKITFGDMRDGKYAT